ncbi:hypothetical protein NC651_007069 [Populus alba x Populus x berolinensis]|nr:hypothetical protein NC651_007069 [Populus alba x Populus x berolinensis]
MKQLLFIGVWCTTMSFSVYRTAIFLFFTLKIGSALAFSVYGATSVSKTCWLVFLHHCQMEELHPLDIKASKGCSRVLLYRWTTEGYIYSPVLPLILLEKPFLIFSAN